MRVCIVDCYSDEPAGLGVPPYIGTTPRYVFGAVLDGGGTPNYMNIDDVRSWWGEDHQTLNLTKEPLEVPGLLTKSDIVVVLGGAHTPGKYLRGRPAVPREIERIIREQDSTTIVGGPVVDGTMGGGRGYDIHPDSLGNPDHIIDGDPEKFIGKYVAGEKAPAESARRGPEELERYALQGTRMLRQVKTGPDTVLEVETSRGCTRAIVGGCSFCSECSRYGLPEYREPSSIISELEALKEEGVANVRLGRQSCFFSYYAKETGRVEIPRPEPDVIEGLLSSCSRLKFNSLHIDNVNPAVVSRYPNESRSIISSLLRHCTPGNVAALGIESADPGVIRDNNLKCGPDESMEAIEIFSRYGGRLGFNGQPSLLAGVNLVLGLPGETRNTYDLNREFLQTILDRGLMVRRINIRKVIPVRGTPLGDRRWSQRAMSKYSRGFTRWVRENIDREMLKRVYPVGRVMRGLVSEIISGSTAFSRFPGSYPVIVGVKDIESPRVVTDVLIVGHGFRSLTALPCPFDINSCRQSTLESIPGVGPRRAARIILSRPINSHRDLVRSLEDDNPGENVLSLISRAASLN